MVDLSSLQENEASSPLAKHSFSHQRPALLPAFEPDGALPSFSRPAKRRRDGSPVGDAADYGRYPTPLPTSSTAINLSSSPGRANSTRPGLKRTMSTVSHASERVPLGAVPSVQLPSNGEPVLLGRSSNSSHYQLSANRLISRIHVRASYKPAMKEVVIECLGWNGCTIHCRGQAWVLGKGDTFSSDRPTVEIMLDVQDARVLVKWPSSVTRSSPTFSEATWADEEEEDHGSPSRARTPAGDAIPSSPPVLAHLRSPVSPSPRRNFAPESMTFLGALPSDQPAVEVYEDEGLGEEIESPIEEEKVVELIPHPSKESMSSSSLSSVPDDADDSDHDEENDPVVHSFHVGPSLLPRLASINTRGSPEPSVRPPLKASASPQQHTGLGLSMTEKPFADLGVDISPIKNHVVNQLAYSRLHSLPLSTIFNALPTALRLSPTNPKPQPDSPGHVENADPVTESSKVGRSFHPTDLKTLLLDTPCVGSIKREGKDAAGKQLEDQYYYVPEMDSDEMRRGAVQNSRGSGLRSVRKQHKQYYWKRPRF